MAKIRKGDEIIVITGKDKGKRGVVSQWLGEMLLVAGINRVKKHVKPNPMKGETGGIIEKRCRSGFLTSRCSTRPPKRRIVLVTSCWTTVARFECLSRTAKSLTHKE